MEVLTALIHECGLICKQGLYRYNQFKIKSYVINVALNPRFGVLVRRKRFGDMQIYK